ncbi:MAG: hydrogenase maturation protease [Anaerolineaceae bacterium]|nr:MAG: hydrogenase maturation protease [Anaerolineaceae bacterium]
MNILVLGIGQSLRGDDAAGLEAVRLWRETHPQTARRVRVETAELPGLALLDLLMGADAAILVDAVQAAAPAGTVIRVGPDELAAFTPDAQSAHGWGVAETLQLGRALDPALAHVRVTLLGIVGKDFGMGAALSPEVQQALAEAAERIEAEVQELLAGERG